MTTSGSYVVIGGLAIGLLGGVLAASPHIHDWSLMQLFLVVLGGGAIGAVVGYFLIFLITGTLISESGSGIGDASNSTNVTGSNKSSYGGSWDSDGSGSGDGGGGDG